jgi:LEA14-like dessication related protein
MDNKNFLILGIVGILAFVGIKKYNMAKNVNVRFNNAGLNGGSFPNYNINITLDVINPTNTSAQIQSLNGELIVQNETIGYVNDSTAIVVAPNSTTRYSFDVSVNVFTIVSTILNSDWTKEQITFDGALTVDFITIPVYFDYKLSF